MNYWESQAWPYMHWTYCSRTRGGKSEFFRSMIVPQLRQKRFGYLQIDPPGSLARKLLLDLDFLGRTDDIIYIRLGDTDLTVGFDWIVPSTATDELVRRGENEERRDKLKSMILFRRALQNTTKNPVIEEGLNAALDLLYYEVQDGFKSPEYWLLRAFEPNSSEQNFLLSRCQNPVAVQRVQLWNCLSIAKRDEKVGPALRILEQYFGKTAVMAHTRKSVDLRAHWNRGGIVLVDGDNVPEDARNTMLMNIIHMGVDHCLQGADLPLVIGIDESAKLTDAYISQQLSEIAKYKCFFHLKFQNPLDFLTQEIRNNVTQNTFHWWGPQGNPDAAAYAAQDIATCLLDPLAVHYVERRLRQLHESPHYEETRSKSVSHDEHGNERISETRGERVVPRYRDDYDEITHYKKYQDQEKDVQQILMTMPRGFYYYRDEKVSPKPVPFEMRPEPWSSLPGLSDVKRQKAYDVIRERSIYREPVLLCPPQCQPPSKQSPLANLVSGGTTG